MALVLTESGIEAKFSYLAFTADEFDGELFCEFLAVLAAMSGSSFGFLTKMPSS